MQKRYKRLVPRRTSTGESAPGDGVDPPRSAEEPPSKKVRKNVTVACIQCQKRKCKCDGARPVCSSCVERKLNCSYNVAEGISRKDDLENKNVLLGSQISDFELLIRGLRSGTDHASTSILARLRLGDGLEDILTDLRGQAFVKEENSTPPVALTSLQSSRSSTGQPSQPLSPTPDKSRWFYMPLFHRSDWLEVAVDGEEDENEDHGKVDGASATTPQHLLSSSRTSSAECQEPDSMMDGVRQSSAKRVSKKISTGPAGNQSVLLPWTVRQKINPQIRLHPNVHNYFFNLPFSTAILANHYDPDVQEQQVANLSVPSWAMMLPHSRITPRVNDAFQEAFDGAQKLLARGVTLEQICGRHCHVAALYDEEVFHRAPFLCQWAARMVHSVKQQSWGFTAFGSAYLFWFVVRWIIEPSPQTYEDIPEWLRPTPNQLFVPHESWVDTIVWPAFRELVLQVGAMQTDTAWVIKLAETIGCDWSGTTEDALTTDPETNEVDLTLEAKEAALNLNNWHLAPSFRQYVINADAYIRIKGEEDRRGKGIVVDGEMR